MEGSESIISMKILAGFLQALTQCLHVHDRVLHPTLRNLIQPEIGPEPVPGRTKIGNCRVLLWAEKAEAGQGPAGRLL
jgi:hypothetical protein